MYWYCSYFLELIETRDTFTLFIAIFLPIFSATMIAGQETELRKFDFVTRDFRPDMVAVLTVLYSRLVVFNYGLGQTHPARLILIETGEKSVCIKIRCPTKFEKFQKLFQTNR